MLEITSPSLASSATEALFPSYSEDQQAKSSTGTTPYFTASATFPHLQNQEFFNAIENRFNLNGPFVKEQQLQQEKHALIQHFPISKAAAAAAAAVTMNIQRLPSLKNNKKQQSGTSIASTITSNSGRNLSINPFTPKQVNDLLDVQNILLVDVRSFVKYNQLHIRNSINIAVPNTILKRPSFSLAKITEAIVTEFGRLSWRNYKQMTHIILYDDQSSSIIESFPNAIYYLTMKLLNDGAGYQGVVGFLHGN